MVSPASKGENVAVAVPAFALSEKPALIALQAVDAAAGPTTARADKQTAALASESLRKRPKMKLSKIGVLWACDRHANGRNDPPNRGEKPVPS
jgi:hypothetical protein